MKNALLFSLFSTALIAQAQVYVPSGSVMTSSNSNVGLNNSTPSYNLDIYGGSLRLESTTPNRSLILQSSSAQSITATNDFTVFGERNIKMDISNSSWGQGNGAFIVENGLTNNTLLFLSDNGKLGVNNSSPVVEFDVNGAGHISGDITVDNEAFFGGSTINPSKVHVFEPTLNLVGVDVISGGWGAAFNAEYIGVVGRVGYMAINGTTSGDKYGLVGQAKNGSTVCGVYGVGDGTSLSPFAYGVQGHVHGDGSIYGVYGDHGSGSGTQYAGYFDGDVFTTGAYLPSDRKLKKNIREFNDAVSIIQQLEAKEYEYRVGEFQGMNLREGSVIGFIAEDLKKVMPELVKPTTLPEQRNQEGLLTQEEVRFEAVDYISLVPILVQAVKEQQERIDYLQSQIESSRNGSSPNGTEEISSEMESILKVYPNPTSDIVKIDMGRTPEHEVKFGLADINGKVVKSGVFMSKMCQLDLSNLTQGTYVLTLSSENQILKSQIVTKF